MTPYDVQHLIQGILDTAAVLVFVLLACAAFLTFRAGR